MSYEDDLRYARARAQAHGFDYHAGNRDREQWGGPGRGWQTAETRGPSALEIALVRRLGNKVRLYNSDFQDIRGVTVHRTEDPRDGSVILEVRDKNDARGRVVDMVRKPDGSYAADQYQGL